MTHGDHTREGQTVASGDCSEALLRLYEFLDGEMDQEDCRKIQAHLDDCGPCLKQYHLDQTLKAVIKRSCASEEAPLELRTTILTRITMIRLANSD